jgi:hypothetical protein
MYQGFLISKTVLVLPLAPLLWLDRSTARDLTQQGMMHVHLLNLLSLFLPSMVLSKLQRFPFHLLFISLVLHWSPFSLFNVSVPFSTFQCFHFQGSTLFCSLRFSKPDEQAAQLPPDEERCTFYSRDFGIGQQRRCKRPRKEGYKQCEHHVELRRKRAQKAKEGGAAVPAIEEPPVPEEQRCTYWAQQ